MAISIDPLAGIDPILKVLAPTLATAAVEEDDDGCCCPDSPSSLTSLPVALLFLVLSVAS